LYLVFLGEAADMILSDTEKGQAMDINEFIKQVKPRAKRSQLDPFKSQIFELRELGYANGQIRDWLATNGIEVTQESVRKFVVTRESASAQPAHKEKAVVVRPRDQGTSQRLVVTSPLTGGDRDTDEPGAEANGLSPKQRREKRADEFIKSENTVLNKLVKKKDP
jgi:hypothetical protein